MVHIRGQTFPTTRAGAQAALSLCTYCTFALHMVGLAVDPAYRRPSPALCHDSAAAPRWIRSLVSAVSFRPSIHDIRPVGLVVSPSATSATASPTDSTSGAACTQRTCLQPSPTLIRPPSWPWHPTDAVAALLFGILPPCTTPRTPLGSLHPEQAAWQPKPHALHSCVIMSLHRHSPASHLTRLSVATTTQARLT